MDEHQLDNSWQRFPEARIRMRENGLKLLLDGLGENGFCLGSIPRVIFDNDGVYVEILLNVGKHGSIEVLPLEILIPAEMHISPKKEEQHELEVDIPVVSLNRTDELRDETATEAGPASSNDRVQELQSVVS